VTALRHGVKVVGIRGGARRAALTESSADLLYRGFMAVYWVILSRTLRQGVVGTLALANAIAVPISVAIDAGFSQFLIREFRVEGLAGLPSGLKRAVTQRYAMIVGSVLAATFAVTVIGDTAGRAWIGLFIAVSYGFDAVGQVWLTGARARLHLAPYVLFRLIESAGVVVATSVLWIVGPYNGIAVAALSALVYAVAGGVALRQWLSRPRWIPGHIALPALPAGNRRQFAVFAIATTVYSRLDSIVVQIALGSAALAVYALAFKLVEAARVVPGAVARAVLASASKSGAAPRPGQLPRAIGISVRCGLAIAAILALGGPLASDVLFGPHYARPAVQLIRILAITVAILGFTNPMSSLFLAWHHERVAAVNAISTLVLTAAAAISLVALWGTLGVAIGVVVGEVLSGAMYVIGAHARPRFRANDMVLAMLVLGSAVGCLVLPPFSVFTLGATCIALALGAVSMLLLAHNLASGGPQ
jgi:O-antigen/teichoic acid export membrane protein